MTTRKPASLDGSLLARKGSAVPAVPQNSPLTEELGEPRPEAEIVHFDMAATAGAGTEAAPEPAPPPPRAFLRRRGTIAAVALALLAALLLVIVKLVPTADHAAVKAPAPESDVAATAPPEGAAVPPSGGPVVPPSAEPVPAIEPAGPSADDAAVDRERTDGAGGPAGPVAAPPAVPLATVAPAAVPPSAVPQPPALPAAPQPAVVPARQAEAKNSTPLPAKKPESRPARAVSSPYVLQLAALPTAAAARAEAARLQKRFARVLGKRKVATIKAKFAENRTVYRLRVSGYRSLEAARAACHRIQRQKAACIVIKQ